MLDSLLERNVSTLSCSFSALERGDHVGPLRSVDQGKHHGVADWLNSRGLGLVELFR